MIALSARHEAIGLERDKTSSMVAHFEHAPGLTDAIVERALAAYWRVADRVVELLPDGREVASFLDSWDAAGPSPDASFYDAHAEVFNRVYFPKNFLKCLLTVASLPPKIFAGHILADVGCGAGPLALACNLLQPPRHSFLIDRCGPQLKAARVVFARSGLDISRSTVRLSVPRDVSLDSSVIRSASYLVSELAAQGETDAVELFAPARLFVIVDTPQTIRDIRKCIPEDYILRYDTVSFEVSGSLCGTIEGGGGRFGYLVGKGERTGQRFLPRLGNP